MSFTDFSIPVSLKYALCCFSIIRTGLINGAENIDANVAATNPGSPPSFIKKDAPNKNQNFGTRLMPTPTKRGNIPDKEADTGEYLKTFIASNRDFLGSIIFPLLSFANCCTN